MIDIKQDRLDFAAFLKEEGLSALQMDSAKNILPKPIASLGVSARKSRIEGMGAFADAGFQKDDVVCHARHGINWTVAGRYTNHSASPNVEARPGHHSVKFVAIKTVPKGEEITVDYRSVKQAIIKGISP